MAAAGRLVFRRGNDVKAALDAVGHVFVKGPRQSSPDGHGGLVFASSLKTRPSVSIKASGMATQDGTMVVDAAIGNANPIPGNLRPTLVFTKGSRATVEFTYVQNSGCLRARGSFVHSFGRRKNAAKAQKIERDNLRDSLIALQQRTFPGYKTDPIPGGVTFWFKQDEIHQATHVHAFPPWRGIAFLSWHREIVNRLEDMLRAVDPTVSLHYWDWNTNPSDSNGVNLMTSEFMGAANGDAGDPWLSAGFYDPNANPHRDNGTAADPPLQITRDKAGGTPQLPNSDSDVVNSEAFPQMRALLENRHNSAHGYIGGTLSDPHASFRDPFVFLLHSNVDRIWASWQVKPGKEWRLDPELVYGEETNTDIDPNAGIYDPGILTPLDPWAGDPTDHPEVQEIRPWTSPENEQVIKNSKHPSVVRPRLYAEYA
jgi:Common central domain of tyrosinase